MSLLPIVCPCLCLRGVRRRRRGARGRCGPVDREVSGYGCPWCRARKRSRSISCRRARSQGMLLMDARWPRRSGQRPRFGDGRGPYRVRRVGGPASAEARAWGGLLRAEMVVLGDRMAAARFVPTCRAIDLVREEPQSVSVPVALAPRPTAHRRRPRRRALRAPTAEAPRAPEPSRRRTRTAPAPVEFSAAPELRTIHFDFDRFEIRPGDAAILDPTPNGCAPIPRRSSDRSHCDERGTAEYNLALGERRPLDHDLFPRARLNGTRITITSYGLERPLLPSTRRGAGLGTAARPLVKPK